MLLESLPRENPSEPNEALETTLSHCSPIGGIQDTVLVGRSSSEIPTKFLLITENTGNEGV